MSTVTERSPALQLAAAGLRIFPLRRGSKLPASKGWQDQATSDPATVAKWTAPGRNYGIAMGNERTNPTTGELERLVGIDTDLKEGVNGLATLKAKCAAAGLAGIPPTRVHETRSGGHHFLYWTSAPIRQGVHVLGERSGVDIRDAGGYLVGPGSVVEGGGYRVLADLPIATMPPEFAALFPQGAGARAPQAHVVLPGIDAERALKRATEWLATAPASVEGEGGDTTAFRTAAEVRSLGVGEADCLDLLLGDWNEACDPPWEAEELAAKVSNAYAYAKDAQGAKDPGPAFSPVEKTVGEDAAPHPLEKLNAEYAFVLIGGTACVLWETDDERGEPRTEFLTLQAFKSMLAATRFQSGSVNKPIAEMWLEWSGRRTYHKLAFAPGKTLAPQFYNMWRGFAVAPAPGKWPRMRAHIRDVICSGDGALDAYVMGWLARAVQLPGERGEVALVLKGGKGTGKGTLGHAVRRIFGRHGVHVANAKHLIGSFNGHLREAAFLFADEAFWAGSKEHESVLKSIITEPTLLIEAKGQDAVVRDNCLHVLMASNEDWAVPASADERRFAVIEVSTKHQQDEAYFDAIAAELAAGGLEAMLYDLLAYPLAGFSVRKVPQTKALGDQKLVGLRGAERWLYDSLAEGGIDQLHARTPWSAKELHVAKSSAYDDYATKSRRYGEHHPIPKQLFWKVVRQVLTGFRETRAGASQIRTAVFPPLHQAREAFAKHLRTTISWDEPVDVFS